MSTAADQELKRILLGCSKGDKSCQKALFERLYGRMLGMCMRYAKDRDEAKDFAQEGLMKVFDKLDRYDGKGSFDGWARRIVVNNTIDSIRKKKGIYLSIDRDDGFEIEAEEEEGIESETLSIIGKERLLEEIQKLPPAYKAVFNLYVIENYKHHEIGTILGISEGTSKSNLSKAKQKLKIALTNILKKENV